MAHPVNEAVPEQAHGQSEYRRRAGRIPHRTSVSTKRPAAHEQRRPVKTVRIRCPFLQQEAQAGEHPRTNRDGLDPHPCAACAASPSSASAGGRRHPSGAAARARARQHPVWPAAITPEPSPSCSAVARSGSAASRSAGQGCAARSPSRNARYGRPRCQFGLLAAS